MPKRPLYKEFLTRIDASITNEAHLEASWYAYAVLEDRLRSMLINSGGEGEDKGGGKPIWGFEKKYKALKKRARKDNLLKQSLPAGNINTWRKSRNALIHGMADGSLTIEQIDLQALELAHKGKEFAREYCNAAQWLKKHRTKISTPPL